VPLTQILDPDLDLTPYFGISAAEDPDLWTLLLRIQKYVESSARKFVRHGIAQNTYTEFQRKRDIGTYDSELNQHEKIGSKVYSTGYSGYDGEFLQLDNAFVTAVSNVYEDMNARFGSGGTDFAAATELTYNTDYYIELDDANISKSGRLIRVARNWSSRPGTIKIVYTAGFTAAQLDDEYAFVKMALLEDIREKYDLAKAQRSGSSGIPKKETYFGDYQVEYSVDSSTRTTTGLSMKTMDALQPIKSMVI
jgi:hypothetical protein